MLYAGEQVIAALRAARKDRGLSQRDLSAMAGVPQSHISRIEKGAVDLQLSSLIALARVLDLEIMAAPRKLVPAIEAVTHSEESAASRQGETALRVATELNRIQNSAERLHFSTKDTETWRRFRQTVNELANLRLNEKDLLEIRTVSNMLRNLTGISEVHEPFLSAAKKLQRIRNVAVHRGPEPAAVPEIRPAYSLDEDNDA